MNCLVCGGDNREGAHFCRHCGARMGEEPGTGIRDSGPVEAPGGESPPAEEGAQGVGPEEVIGQPEGAAEEGPEGEELGPGTGGQEVTEEAGEPAPPQDAVQASNVPAAGEGGEGIPPVVLPVGTVIAGRYVVLEVVASPEGTVEYAVRDLCYCWQCDFDGNTADDLFCARCGADLGRASARLLRVPAGGEAAQEADALEHEGLRFRVQPLPRLEPPPEGRPALRLIVGQRSDVGLARELNEDSLVALTVAASFGPGGAPVLGLYAVADGMGGHEGGEVASRLALRVLVEEVMAGIVPTILAGEALPAEALAVRLASAVVATNDAVYLARHKRGTDMGTTLTVLLLCDDHAVVAHVGDSRAFRWNAEGLRQLTVDHSMVASLVAAGRAAPEEVYTHPQRSVIYRCIGDQPLVEVDTAALPLAVGDRLIVCSDGLWEMVRNEGIEDGLMQEADPQAACDLLVRRANLAGGEDNISVIVVQVEDFSTRVK